MGVLSMQVIGCVREADTQALRLCVCFHYCLCLGHYLQKEKKQLDLCVLLL